MRVGELFAQVWRGLTANKLRSFLTMFGIAWGIVSIVLMMAAVEGLKVGQKQAAETLGKDIMIVMGGITSRQAGGERAGRRIFLEQSDADLIRGQCGSVALVTPEEGLSRLVRSDYNSGRFLVTGGLPFFAQIRSLELADGRLWNDSDERDTRRVAVIGYEVKSQLFYSRNPVGQTVHVNGVPYLVIGYLAKKDQDSNYDGPDNNKVFVPFSTAMKDLPDPAPGRTATSVDRLIVTPRGVDEHERLDGEVRRVLARRHGFDPQDKDAVFIWDTVKQSKLFEAMTAAMGLFLGGVGLITLALGGIGIMNVMLVSVTERTREIGVRMAVGATRTAVLHQFFLEAVVLTALSGAGGLGVAAAICYGVTAVIPTGSYFAGLIFTPQAALIAFFSLALVAIGAGTYPARKAAALQPIDALRYEH
jgi:putative ABC transport system permease protein